MSDTQESRVGASPESAGAGPQSPQVPRRPFADWSPELGSALKSVRIPPELAVVIEDVASTQDVARSQAKHGLVVAAWRQRSGRGRLGRVWADTGEDGVAMSMVMQCDAGPILVMAAACATALAIERSVSQSSGLTLAVALKWPNDAIIRGKKVAGVLIEHDGRLAVIGVGINVHQQGFSPDLADRAASLAQCGYQLDRLALMGNLVIAMHECLAMPADRVLEEYTKRDCLR